MKRIILNPIYHLDGYSVLLEHEVLAYFRETLFDPLFHVLGLDVRVNAAPREREHSAVWDALLAGTLWFRDGLFAGAFSAAISRELRAMGARKTAAGFVLTADEVPIALRGAIATAGVENRELHQAVLTTLDRIEGNLATAPTGVDMTTIAKPIVQDLQKQLVQTAREAKDAVVKVPPAPVDLPAKLAENVSQVTERAIKGFTVEETQRLRDKVKANLANGGHGPDLAGVIEAEFGVAKRKARIIAEQETSQIVSDFRKDRYRALGSKSYVWQDSGDNKVRPTHGESNNHRVLNRRQFAWDSPPIVDTATGRRCHPGEDYGPCRCVARPVLTFA